MRFTRAIVRPPSSSFSRGLTRADLGPPDLDLALAQHAAYCAALGQQGLALTRLEPDASFPDSTFVEDTAIVTPRGAILCRPGAPSRRGEVEGIRGPLGGWLTDLSAIVAPGTLEGGDVCEAENLCFIGRSERTNKEGVAQLARWLEARGYDWSVVDIRGCGGLLHLKSGVASLGDRRLVVAEELAGNPAFRGYELIPVPVEETFSVNCMVVNGAVFLPAGYPLTAGRLERLGYAVVPLAMSEFRKMDGGLSCLSLRG
jgi:dimethylargininase